MRWFWFAIICLAACQVYCDDASVHVLDLQPGHGAEALPGIPSAPKHSAHLKCHVGYCSEQGEWSRKCGDARCAACDECERDTNRLAEAQGMQGSNVDPRADSGSDSIRSRVLGASLKDGAHLSPKLLDAINSIVRSEVGKVQSQCPSKKKKSDPTTECPWVPQNCPTLVTKQLEDGKVTTHMVTGVPKHPKPVEEQWRTQIRNCAGYCNPTDLATCEGLWVREVVGFEAIKRKHLGVLQTMMMGYDFISAVACKPLKELKKMIPRECCAKAIGSTRGSVRTWIKDPRSSVKKYLGKKFKQAMRKWTVRKKWTFRKMVRKIPGCTGPKMIEMMTENVDAVHADKVKAAQKASADYKAGRIDSEKKFKVAIKATFLTKPETKINGKSKLDQRNVADWLDKFCPSKPGHPSSARDTYFKAVCGKGRWMGKTAVTKEGKISRRCMRRMSTPARDPFCWTFGPSGWSRPPCEVGPGLCNPCEVGPGLCNGTCKRKKAETRLSRVSQADRQLGSSWGFAKKMIKKAKRGLKKFKGRALGGLKKMALKLVPRWLRKPLKKFLSTKGSMKKRVFFAFKALLKSTKVKRLVTRKLTRLMPCDTHWMIPKIVTAIQTMQPKRVFAGKYGVFRDIRFADAVRDHVIRSKILGSSFNLLMADCYCQAMIGPAVTPEAEHYVELTRLKDEAQQPKEWRGLHSPLTSKGPYGPFVFTLTKFMKGANRDDKRKCFFCSEIGLATEAKKPKPRDSWCEMEMEFDYLVCRDSPKWRLFLAKQNMTETKGPGEGETKVEDPTYPYWRPSNWDPSQTYSDMTPGEAREAKELYPGAFSSSQICGPPNFGSSSEFLTRPVKSRLIKIKETPEEDTALMNDMKDHPKKYRKWGWLSDKETYEDWKSYRKERRSECKAWFGMVDSFMRGWFGIVGAALTVKNAAACVQDPVKKDLCENLKNNEYGFDLGKKIKASSPQEKAALEVFQHACKEDSSKTLGDSETQGRRGGRSFGASSMFAFGGSNRAGNSERLKDEL